jgi:hypothetical protein
MTTVRVVRIECDNPECVVYVDELERESPGEVSLIEHVTSLVVGYGWTRIGNNDFCPDHGSNAEGFAPTCPTSRGLSAS